VGAASYGKRKNVRRPGAVSLKGLPRTVGRLFLDSGAHSLYNAHVLNKPRATAYDWYVRGDRLTKEFRQYLDTYATFIKRYGKGIDYYVTVDAIHNPHISWQSQKYLEQEHGLNPVPVLHDGALLGWFEKYLNAGYKFIGIGGLGQESTRRSYQKWADGVFSYLCRGQSRLPCVKAHGFAMTSYLLMIRYPWWSVDSSSWAKAAGYGMILVPHKRQGQFTFEHTPYAIGMSCDSPASLVQGRHYDTLARMEQKIVREWLEQIDMPLGKVNDKKETLVYGVRSEYNARAVANLKFFEALCNWLPKWPRPFKVRIKRGLLT